MRTVSALNEAGFTGTPPSSSLSHLQPRVGFLSGFEFELKPSLCPLRAEITMYETLLRPHQVDAVPPLVSVATVGAQLKKAEARREEKRLRQIAQARAAKRKRGEAVGDDNGDDGGAGKGDTGKRAKTDTAGADDTGDVPMSVASGTATPVVVSAAAAEAQAQEDTQEEEEAALPNISVSKAFPEVRGHTSYLTFAVLLPSGGAYSSASPTSNPATPKVETPLPPSTSQ